jgi:S-adenosylmethionine synthetase
LLVENGMDVIVSRLELEEGDCEVVERKGIGHPDTICDALAENLSRNLCREYRKRFGAILHHNVDKVLLAAGRSAPAFGAGEVLAPIHLCLAGRATEAGDGATLKEIGIEGSRDWLRKNLHALDAERHVDFHWLVQSTSRDLQQLFARSHEKVPLANDTSIGVGYAPLSALERLVLATEKKIHASRGEHPAWGEDVKVMGLRQGHSVDLTVSCAIIGNHVATIEAYAAETRLLEALVRGIAAEHGFPDSRVTINAGDDLSAGTVYLTVTGTSAEHGDDGEVGRGNRINGLITPYRPMSLEAAAGKNPVTHVGKIYNVVARQIAQRVAAVPGIAAAQCFLISRIGRPLTEPALLHIGLATLGGLPASQFATYAREIAHDSLAVIPALVDDFVAGKIDVF